MLLAYYMVLFYLSRAVLGFSSWQRLCLLFHLAVQKMPEGLLASYLGVEVAYTPIPSLFHPRSGAPMLTMSFVTVAPTRWKLTLTPVEVSELTDVKNR